LQIQIASLSLTMAFMHELNLMDIALHD